MNQEIILTPEGYLELETELNNLKNVERPRVIKDLKDARAQGDLSENADYDAARDRQAKVEARIADLEVMLANYELIDTSKTKSKVVRIGSTVTLLFMDINKEFEYSIVGTTEADPLNGKLSNETPLAEAIIDHKVGQTVTVNVDKPYDVKIVAVK